jgi:lipopolysaccharide/colanic/teichoic acid biosynthesis glycosyltransferase
MDKNTIIYIGDDDKMSSFLSNHFTLLQVKDISEFYKKYDSLKLRNIHSIIVDFWDEDVKTFLFHKHNAELFILAKIPFLLYARNKVSSKNKNIAKSQGIDDIIAHSFDETALLLRILWLKNHTNDKLEKINNLQKKSEEKIPLWKRSFDIFFSSIAIVLASPILLLIIILLKLESKGPIFYISKRVGMGYKIFDFYKFRSMYVDADQRLKELEHLNQYAEEKLPTEETKKNNSAITSDTVLIADDATISESEFLKLQKEKQEKPFVKIKNDPRITKVGRFIRKTSLDELPQLFNVLKGDMSIVGNRPIPLYEAEMLTSDRWAERFLAPAGITGLWQVTKRGKANMSNEERKELDNIYAHNFSFFYDLKIILKTFKALLQTEDV